MAWEPYTEIDSWVGRHFGCHSDQHSCQCSDRSRGTLNSKVNSVFYVFGDICKKIMATNVVWE